MPSSYSANLKIELQATGENSGTWGTITNTNLGTALEQAVVGYGNPNYISDANLTLTYTDTNAAQTARALVLNVTSGVSLSATRELVVPTIQKQYIVQNNTTGSQSITVKTSAGTGITVPNGRKAHLYVDGTNVILMDDFVDINGGAIDGTPIGANSASTGAFTTLSSSGTTTLSSLTASTALALDASKNVVSVTNTGTGNNVLSASPTLTGTISAAAATLSGNLTLSGGTANGVLYLNGSKVATSGSALTFNGSVLATTGRFEGGANLGLLLNNATGAYAAWQYNGTNVGEIGTANQLIGGGGTDDFAINTRQAAGDIVFGINTSEAMRLTSTGLGIGTASPGVKLDVVGSATSAPIQASVSNTSTTGQYPSASYLIKTYNGSSVATVGSVGGTSSTFAYQQIAANQMQMHSFRSGGMRFAAASSGPITWATGSNTDPDFIEEKMRLDSSGRLLVKTTATQNAATPNTIELGGNGSGSGDQPSVIVKANTGTTAANTGYLTLTRSRGTTDNAATIVAADDRLGMIRFSGANGTGFDRAAEIYAEVDGTPGASNDMPGRIVFATTADGSATPTERMRLDSSGNLGIGTASPAVKLDVNRGSSGVVMNLNSVNAYDAETGITFSESRAKISSFLNTSGGTPGSSLRFYTMPDGGSVTERLRIDSSGNLGIGTASPSTKLEIYGGAAGTAAYATIGNATTAGVFGVGTGNDVQVRTAQAVPITFFTSGLERMRLDSSGNLGIGTTSSGGSASNTARVTGGIFSTFNATPSIANNTATTVATLPSGEGMYLVSASLQGSGSAADWNELALVRVSQSNTAVSTIVGAANLDITLSGLDVQVTQRQGNTQTIPVAIIRLL